MKLLDFYEAQAARLFRFRYLFLGMTVATIALALAATYAALQKRLSPDLYFMALNAAALVMAWSWGLFCLCFWFNPTWGVLRRRGPDARGILAWAGRIFRGYAAVFLTIFLLGPALFMIVWLLFP